MFIASGVLLFSKFEFAQFKGKIIVEVGRSLNVGFAHTLLEGNSRTNRLAKLGASLTHELRIISAFSSLSRYCLADDMKT
ncbi:hypothetical protein MTR_1g055090 [Medicago truncatula]|uniref:Uncharacterized protein n=1 Tax=Medicago truncatula TaxID=3880 RepID=A0A072VK80_MEDTR|nr:hypothetical protein MTR_1g055090 [Medicago truncatula]